MQHLLQEAKRNIEFLRHENAILRAKVEVVDIFAGAIFGNRPGDPQPMGPDITWELKLEIDRLEKLARAETEKQEGDGKYPHFFRVSSDDGQKLGMCEARYKGYTVYWDDGSQQKHVDLSYIGVKKIIPDASGTEPARFA